MWVFVEYPSLTNTRHFDTSLPHKRHSFSVSKIRHFNTNPSLRQVSRANFYLNRIESILLKIRKSWIRDRNRDTGLLDPYGLGPLPTPVDNFTTLWSYTFNYKLNTNIRFCWRWQMEKLCTVLIILKYRWKFLVSIKCWSCQNYITKNIFNYCS